MVNRNPDTSGLKPFKKGQSGNPGGLSSERKRLLNESAEIAARIMHRQLEALEGMFRENPEKEAIVASITADVHRIVKDAIDRAEGMAKSSVDVSVTSRDPHELSDAELARIAAGDGKSG